MDMIKTLEKAFVEMDAKVLEIQTNWALERKAAVSALKSEMASRPGVGGWDYYNKLFAVAGGKTWYNVFNGRNVNMVKEFVVKNCKAIADKRNATIVSKLKKAGITEIGEIELHYTNDGFNGIFVFEGVRVEIRTIYAGGYNIQCLHQRTLVYVDGKKAS